MAFMPKSEVVSKPVYSTIPQCGACKLHKTCQSPKIPVGGKGRKGILVITSSIDSEEDAAGRYLRGAEGQFLREEFWEFGVDIDKDCWTTSAIICRPPKGSAPTDNQIEYCRPNLKKTIEELKPRQIIPLGISALKSLIAPIWKEGVGGLGDWVGWKIPYQGYNTWITPTYPPSYVMKKEDEKEKREAPLYRVWFKKHLEEMLSLEGRPWDVVPDYESQIKILMNPKEVAAWIRDKISRGGAVAFDYETDRLKPDSEDSEIVCCSISWKGKETIAFPLIGEAIEAMREFLQSDLPKIGANTKFEDRWSRAKLGVSVNNWVWDDMLSAHHLDNRGGIASVKFQGFVRLGQGSWDWKVKKFLEAPDSNAKNKIRSVDIRTLLLYCGMDALIEYLVAMKQKEELKKCQKNE